MLKEHESLTFLQFTCLVELLASNGFKSEVNTVHICNHTMQLGSIAFLPIEAGLRILEDTKTGTF